MSDEENKTRATTGVKFSAFKQVGPQEGNPVQVVGLRDGENVRANLTTDLVETNPDVTFRNAKGQFAAVDPGVTALTNQLKVNRYFYERLAEMGVPIGEDPPSETPQDGAFWFDNSEDVMQLFMWHAESDAWLPIAPPTTLEGRVATGEATQQAIIEAVDEGIREQTRLRSRIGDLESNSATKSDLDTKISKSGEQMLAEGYWRIKQPRSTGGNSTFIVIDDNEMNLYHVAYPQEPEHAANMQYVDDKVAGAGGSTFRVVDVNNTIQMQDGDIWFWDDKVYVSWKTLEGRIWCPNPTLEDWKDWPEGTEHGSQGHGRFIPETYMVWESVEDGHPYGMTTANKVEWKTYLDENGNVVGREGYDTMALKITWSDPPNFTTYPTFPPVGSIIRVRFAPWL